MAVDCLSYVAVCCLLFEHGCVLFVVCFVDCCSLYAADVCCLVFWCLMCRVCWLRFLVYRLLIVVCCLLFVV